MNYRCDISTQLQLCNQASCNHDYAYGIPQLAKNKQNKKNQSLFVSAIEVCLIMFNKSRPCAVLCSSVVLCLSLNTVNIRVHACFCLCTTVP